MNFITDQQTLNDLNLLGRYKPQSIYSFFNKVQTAGGEKLLDNMFRHPLTDDRAINQRSMLFKYFEGRSFPFDGDQLAMIEDYLGNDPGNHVSAILGTARKRITALLLRDDGYKQLKQGVEAVRTAITTLSRLLSALHSRS